MTPTLRAALEQLAAIGDTMRAQDNACTADPIFVVEQRKRQYGIDTDYTENIAWLHEDETVEASAAEAASLEAEYQDDYNERDGWRRVGYVDQWEPVQPFLTRAAAEDYIARRGHNLTAPRVFVDSGYRNPEWQTLRKVLMGLSALLTADTPDPPKHGADGEEAP